MASVRPRWEFGQQVHRPLFSNTPVFNMQRVALSILLLLFAFNNAIHFTEAMPFFEMEAARKLQQSPVGTGRKLQQFFLGGDAETCTIEMAGPKNADSPQEITALVICSNETLYDETVKISDLAKNPDVTVTEGITLFSTSVNGTSYVYIDSDRIDPLDLKNSKFRNLPAFGKNPWAPIVMNGTRALVRFLGVDFTGNKGYEISGGVFMEDGSEIDILDGLFEENEGGFAGALDVGGLNVVEAERMKFIRNTGRIFAGAVHVHGEGDFECEDCEFTGLKPSPEYKRFIRAEVNESPNPDLADAGAISVTDQGTLTVKNSSFLDHTGIHGTIFSSHSSRITVKECYFFNNFITNGGGIYIEGAFDQNALVQRCVFEENEARYGGAFVFLGRGVMSVRTVNFLRNKAFWGGAVYSDFVHPNETEYESCGKATEGSRLIFSGATLDGNVAEESGGAVHAKCTHLQFKETTAIKNKAGGEGGAVALYTGVEIDVENSNFTDNEAGVSGGAIFANNTIIVDFEETIFALNKVGGSKGDGGAVEVHTADKVIYRNTLFMENSAERDGGAVSMKSVGEVNVTNCKIMDNSCGSHGGGVYGKGVGKMILDPDTNITQNSAKNSGGALSIRDAAHLLLNKTSMNSNSAGKSDGGAINLETTGRMEIHNITFELNKANGGCGAIRTHKVGNVTFHETGFVNNEALKSNGGAICLEKVGNLTTFGSTVFLENRAGSGGGAILISESDMITLSDAVFLDNAAKKGGAIHGGGVKNFTVTETEFSNNTGVEDGGAIDIGKGMDVLFRGVVFLENKAGGKGGAARFVNGNEFQFDSVLFELNDAKKDGGALVLGEYDGGQFQNITVMNNTAGGQGGGVYAFDVDDFDVDGSSISNNKAKREGGAFVLSGSGNLEFNGTDFMHNDGGRAGGGISCEGDSFIVITDADFMFNFARKGQSIAAKCSCAVNVTDSEFHRDKSRKNNGDFFDSERKCSNVVALNSLFFGAPPTKLAAWKVAIIVVSAVFFVILLSLLCFACCYKCGLFKSKKAVKGEPIEEVKEEEGEEDKDIEVGLNEPLVNDGAEGSWAGATGLDPNEVNVKVDNEEDEEDSLEGYCTDDLASTDDEDVKTPKK